MSGLEGLLTGRTLVKRYRIEEVIGRGGFAVVYRADDERLGRTVAVKVITAPAPDAETRAQHQERFEREARAAASLSHPNVVTVHDFGTDPSLDIDFLVMEFLHGEDLATYLSRNGRPPRDLGLRILTDAAHGLAVGHRAGLVHRDVKPGNLFLAEPHGADPFRVCVLDFGIARAAAADHTVTRLTEGGIPLSPAYASPEQARGVRELTPATDVFSLGVVGYQLLTGEKPFPGERPDDPAAWTPGRSIRDLTPDVPPEVDAVIRRAMSFAPEERFADAAAMVRALDEAVAGSGPEIAVVAPAPPAPEPPEDATLMQAPPPAPAAAPPPREPAPAPPPPRAAPAGGGGGGKMGWIAAAVLLLLVGAVAVFAVGGGGGGDDGEGIESPGGGPVAVPEVDEDAADPVEAGPAASPGWDAVAEAPATGGELPASGPATVGGGLPPAAQPSGGGATLPGPATSRPTPGLPPSAAPTPPFPRPTPAAPAPQRPAQAAPDSAAAQPADSTPRPRLLGVPVREPPQGPPPRDTARVPRSDTAGAASAPDSARTGGDAD